MYFGKNFPNQDSSPNYNVPLLLVGWSEVREKRTGHFGQFTLFWGCKSNCMKMLAQTKMAQFEEHCWMDHMAVRHMNGTVNEQQCCVHYRIYLWLKVFNPRFDQSSQKVIPTKNPLTGHRNLRSTKPCLTKIRNCPKPNSPDTRIIRIPISFFFLQMEAVPDQDTSICTHW